MAQTNSKDEVMEGVFIIGMYTGMDTFKGERGESVSVSVLVGRDVHRIYLEGDGGGELQAHQRGDHIEVLARPYVNKKGYLAWGGGEIVDWPDDDDDDAVDVA